MFKGINFIHYIKWILAKINHKIGLLQNQRHSIDNYPPEIFQLFNEAINSSPKGYIFYSHNTISVSQTESPKSIKLAGINYKIENNSIDWDASFDDAEDYMSLHRWNWLLYLTGSTQFNESKRKWIQDQLENWIKKYSRQLKMKDKSLDKLIHWSSYTVGERVSNCVLYHFLNRISPTEIVKSSIISQVRFLLKRLEYFNDFTGNHVLNNARAIYLAGVAFDSLKWREFAKKIIKRELPILVTNDGFLREGSSHYQFLFTRWINEIYFFSLIIEDKDILAFVESHLERLLKSCAFFHVNNEKTGILQIPFFGDISPDFTPEWLIKIPLLLSDNSSRPKKSNKTLNDWCDLFEGKLSSYSNKRFNINTSNVLSASKVEHPQSGWYRYNKHFQTIFMHSENPGIPSYVGHHHIDCGHFCLYYKNRSIFVDQGRLNYIIEKGINAEAHNALTIDGVGLSPLKTSRYPITYSQYKNRLTSHELNNHLEINFSSNGFKRINQGIIWERKIVLREKEFEIIDKISGKYKHKIKTYFHWAPDVQIKYLKNNRINFSGGDISGSFLGPWIENDNFKLREGNDQAFGSIVKSYGELIPAKSLEISCEVNLPIQMNYKIYWNK